jgi:hypothetical protein
MTGIIIGDGSTGSIYNTLLKMEKEMEFFQTD